MQTDRYDSHNGLRNPQTGAWLGGGVTPNRSPISWGGNDNPDGSSSGFHFQNPWGGGGSTTAVGTVNGGVKHVGGMLSSVQFSRPTGLGAAGGAPQASVMQGLKAIQAAGSGSGLRQAANNFLRPQSVGSALSGSGTRSMGGSGVGSALRRQPSRNVGNLFG